MLLPFWNSRLRERVNDVTIHNRNTRGTIEKQDTECLSAGVAVGGGVDACGGLKQPFSGLRRITSLLVSLTVVRVLQYLSFLKEGITGLNHTG